MFGEQPGRRPSPAGVSPTAATHLTVRVEGVGQPLTSNLNLPAGDVRPNLVVVGLENFATIRIYNHAGATHVIVDVQGWFGPPD